MLTRFRRRPGARRRVRRDRILPRVDVGVEPDDAAARLVGAERPHQVEGRRRLVDEIDRLLGLEIGAFYSAIPGTGAKLLGGEVRYAILEGGVASPAVAIRGA